MSWFFRALRRRAWFYNIHGLGLRMLPKPGAREPSTEIDLDLIAAGEPQEPLPGAEISEEERQEAVRRHQRELREKGKR